MTRALTKCLAAIVILTLASCGKDESPFLYSPDKKITFPDQTFSDFCLYGSDVGGVLRGGFDMPETGGNGDGAIQYREIMNVERIDLEESWVYTVESLEGLQYFTSLAYLSCVSCPLASIDVSKNAALTHLIVHGTEITSIDVTKNTALAYLDCGSNCLTRLDVTKNRALTYLDCSLNDITSLDLFYNAALTELYCQYNRIGYLDVSKNTALSHLDCSYNFLLSLDLSNNKALKSLDCSRNAIPSINVSRLGATLRELRITHQTEQGWGVGVQQSIALTVFPNWEEMLDEYDFSVSNPYVDIVVQ